MYGERRTLTWIDAVAFFLRAYPAWARSRGSLFESLCSSCLFELFVRVELSHVETTSPVRRKRSGRLPDLGHPPENRQFLATACRALARCESLL